MLYPKIYCVHVPVPIKPLKYYPFHMFLFSLHASLQTISPGLNEVWALSMGRHNIKSFCRGLIYATDSSVTLDGAVQWVSLSVYSILLIFDKTIYCPNHATVATSHILKRTCDYFLVTRQLTNILLLKRCSLTLLVDYYR